MDDYFAGDFIGLLSGGVDPFEKTGRFTVFSGDEPVEVTDDEQEAVAFADTYAQWLPRSEEAVVMHYGIVHYRATGFAKLVLCD